MRYSVAMATLLFAALLEAGGDALMRRGLHAPDFLRRLGLMLAAGVILAAYGYTVNSPPWDFGRLLGVYVVFFFLIAQGINWTAFGHKPTPSVLVGGLLIVAGGVVVSWDR